MDDIKGILLNMQAQMNGMQNSIKDLQDGQERLEQNLTEKITNVKEELHEEIIGVKEELECKIQDLKAGIIETVHNVQDEMQILEKNLTKEVREVNQRVASFQEEATGKIRILFDADVTRKEKLENHDSEIYKIKKKQSEHTFKLLNLKDSNSR